MYTVALLLLLLHYYCYYYCYCCYCYYYLKYNNTKEYTNSNGYMFTTQYHDTPTNLSKHVNKNKQSGEIVPSTPCQIDVFPNG